MNKVTLDGKPPTEKINLVKKQATIVDLNATPFIRDPNGEFQKVKIGDMYYITNRQALSTWRVKFFKGNPEIGWTEIQLPDGVGYYHKIIEDEGEIYLAFHKESENVIYIYQFNKINNTWTLKNKIDSHSMEVCFYKKGNKSLLLTRWNDNYKLNLITDFNNITDIISQATSAIGVRGADFIDLLRSGFFVNNELYLIRYHPSQIKNKIVKFNFETLNWEFGFEIPAELYNSFFYTNLNNSKNKTFIATNVIDKYQRYKNKIYMIDKIGFKKIKEITTRYVLSQDLLLDCDDENNMIFLGATEENETSSIIQILNVYVKEK